MAESVEGSRDVRGAQEEHEIELEGFVGECRVEEPERDRDGEENADRLEQGGQGYPIAVDGAEPHHGEQDIAVYDEIIVEMESIIVCPVRIGENEGHGGAETPEIQQLPYAAALQRIERHREPESYGA